MSQLSNIRKHHLPADDEERKFQESAYKLAVLEMIEAKKQSKNNRIPHGMMGKWLQTLHDHGFPNVTRDILNKALSKLTRLEQTPSPPIGDVRCVNSSHSEISPLTNTDGIGMNNIEIEGLSTHAEHVTTLTAADNSEKSPSSNDDDCKTSGRPKGTTASARAEEQGRKEICMAEISSAYNDHMLAERSKGHRVKKNFLTN